MAWKQVVNLRIPAIGVQDCVVSWSPTDWLLRVWFVRHVVLDNNNGTIPDFIASFACEVADWTQYLPGKNGAPLVYRPLTVAIPGYGLTATLAPPMVAAIDALGFKYYIPQPGGLITDAGNPPSYVKGKPEASNVFVLFKFDVDAGAGKPKLPVNYPWGASFSYDPIVLPFRISAEMPKPFSKFRLRGNAKAPDGAALVVSNDVFGVPFVVKDVSSGYAYVAKFGKAKTWAIPNRIVRIMPTGKAVQAWEYSLQKPDFFKVNAKAVWIAVRFGHELDYAVSKNGKLLSPKGKNQNSESWCKYEEAYSEINLEGWFD